MEIYIESFIIQNLIINFCLLRLVYLTTKSQTTFFKLFIASLIGTLTSVVVSIFLDSTLIINIFKLSTAILMIILAFKQTKKQFIFNLLLMFIYTYSFGGIIISLNSNIYQTSFGLVMTSKYSLELICFSICVITYIFEYAVKFLKHKIKTSSLIYDLTLYQKNRSLKINAFLDTGNLIEHNGQPVMILDINSFLKLYDINLIEFLTIKTDEISTKTINGKNNLKLFNVDKIEIKNGKKLIKLENLKIAININNTFKNSNYKALISPLFL